MSAGRDQGELFPRPLPPWARSSDTSLRAAVSKIPTATSDRGKVLAHIRAQGARGATCDEIEQALGLSHQNASARVWELAGNGGHPAMIADCGLRRTTASKRKARVMVASATT